MLKLINQKGSAPVLILLAVFLIVVFLLIANIFDFKDKLFSTLFPKPKSEASTGFPNTIYVEPPEKALGPDDRLYDGPFNIGLNSNPYRAYISSASRGKGTTYLFSGNSLDTLIDTGKIVLSAGSSFDSDGAWLMSPPYVSKIDSAKLIGWYHGETHNANPYQIKSIAYSESSDSGDSFVKTNYPNNQVLTADLSFQSDPTSSERNQVGDFKVIPFPLNSATPQYYYMYYQATRDSDSPTASSWTIHLARADINSDGKPGNWYKYYKGSFSEPGLGGKSNSLKTEGGGALSRSWVSFNTDLSKYIGLSDNWNQQLAAVDGSILNTSSDGIHFSPINPYIFTQIDPLTQGYYYGSLIGLDGNPNVLSNTFYLYRSYIMPGQHALNMQCPSNNCYTARYKVTLKEDTTLGEINNFNKIKFVKYQSTGGKDDWDTTGATFYSKEAYGVEYVAKKDLGYLLTSPATGSVALYSCLFDKHMVVTSSEVNNWPACKTNGVFVNGTYIEKIGYTVPLTTPNSRQIYNCFNSSTNRSFISFSSSCDGQGQLKATLGYVYCPPGSCVDLVESTPPTVSITSPANGTAKKRGSQLIVSANANDASGINKVVFKYNYSTTTNTICTDTTLPYSCSFTIPLSAPIGTYNISAIAYDKANNTATSTIKIYVVN